MMTMTTEAPNLASRAMLRAAGIRALAQALGPVGMARFLQQSEDGQGDYSKEKYELPQPSWEEIEAALQTA